MFDIAAAHSLRRAIHLHLPNSSASHSHLVAAQSLMIAFSLENGGALDVRKCAEMCGALPPRVIIHHNDNGLLSLSLFPFRLSVACMYTCNCWHCKPHCACYGVCCEECLQRWKRGAACATVPARPLESPRLSVETQHHPNSLAYRTQHQLSRCSNHYAVPNTIQAIGVWHDPLFAAGTPQAKFLLVLFFVTLAFLQGVLRL